MTNHVEQAALAAHPGLHHLIALRETGWFFQPIHVDGTLELLTGARAWPDGWSDAIAIYSPTNARAFRCNPDGDEVWKHEGTLIEVINALTDLPAPGQPGAPTLVIATHPPLWTPNDRARW